jgi:hypothetical protein
MVMLVKLTWVPRRPPPWRLIVQTVLALGPVSVLPSLPPWRTTCVVGVAVTVNASPPALPSTTSSAMPLYVRPPKKSVGLTELAPTA